MGKTATSKIEGAKVEGAEEAKPAVQPQKPRKRVRRNIPVGIVYVQTTFNNTIVTVTDPSGNSVCWSSSGARGFKGSKKSTPFAAQIAAEDAAQKAMDHGMRTVSVIVKGPGAGRESALRGLSAKGLRVTAIRDGTRMPHNGCRPPKRRRV